MEAVSLEVYGSVEVGGPLSNSEVLLEKEEGRCITVTVAAVTSKPSTFRD